MLKKICTVLLVIGCLFPAAAFAQESDHIPASIKTSQELVDWLSEECSFEFGLNDRWQSSSETIRSGKGDCEDFATVVSEFMTGRGIDNDVLIIKFKGMNISHAVCVWRTEKGTYNFTSNSKLFRTGARDMLDAIGKYYPDWIMLTFTGRSGAPGKVIARK